MKIAMALVVLAVFAGGVAWIVIALRKFKERKAFEREREANFVAQILKAKAAPAAAGASAAPVERVPAVAPAPSAAAQPAADTAPRPAPASAAASGAPASAPPPSATATKPAPADPLAATAESIKASLTAGRGADAAKAFLAVVAQRTQLTLEPPVWEGLGRALLAQGAYLEAAWALHAGAVLANDLVGAQKRLVEVAARAGDAGQPQNALKLYATLLAKYPQSQYGDFVRANMKQEERKLPKG